MLAEIEKKRGSVEDLNNQINKLQSQRNTTVYSAEQEALDKQIEALEYKKRLLNETTSASFSGRGDNSTGLNIIAPKLPTTQNTVVDKEAAKKAAEALSAVNSEIAKLTLNSADLARYDFAKQVDEWEKSLGRANPRIAELVRLKEREIRLNEMASLQPYQVTALEGMNKGDSFYGRAEAEKRSQALIEQRQQEDLQLLTEFAEKHREAVRGETEFKLEQIEAQADAYRRAGADSVAVEQWAAAERLKVSRKWEDGITRALKNIEDEWTNWAHNSETLITGTFNSISDAWSLTTEGMKFDWQNAMDSILNAAFHQMVVNPLLGGIAGSMGGGGGGIFSFLGSFFHAGGMIGRDAPTFTRPVDPAIFVGAPRFHTGLLPNEFPAILENGETVIPKGGFKFKGGNSSGENSNVGTTTEINIHNYGNQQVSQQTSTDNYGNKRIDVMIGDAAAKQMATPGSSLNRAMRTTTGAQQQVVRR